MMRCLFLSFLLVLINASIFAQAPFKMSHQAVVRSVTNTLITNQAIGMRVSILQGSIAGNAVFVETHMPVSNANALITVEIGTGTVVTGSISQINWANGPFFIKTEYDPNGGSNYSVMGTTELISVPYALYANSSGSSIPGPQGPPGPQGIAGTNGKTILNDTLNPQSSIGNDGDFFINTSTSTLFGPKTAGAWPQGISLIGPQGPAGSGGGFTHYIGEKFGGGVVFHIWKDSSGVEHGLIVAATELPQQVWSNVDFFNTNGTAWSSWDGLSNSNGIVAQQGHTNSAAKACLDLISGGQSDWYLPALDEIMLLFTNRFNVNQSLMTIQGANQLGVHGGQYWTSTEVSFGSTTAFMFYAGNFSSGFSSKDVAINYVRAIRKF